MAVCVSVIATSVCGVVLLGILAWKYLGYEYIPNLVSIDQAASMQFDYIIGLFTMFRHLFHVNLAKCFQD